MRSRSRLVVGLLTALAVSSPSIVLAAKHALIIGLDDYQSVREIRRLNYAEQDATDLENALEAQGFRVVSLTNHRATRNEIVRELTKYALDLGEDDTFLLYFSGHGVKNDLVNQHSYWLTYSADLSFLEVNGIRLSHMLDYIADIKAGRKLVMLDHCFSGNLTQRAAAGGGELVGIPGDETRGPGDEIVLARAELLSTEDLRDELRAGDAATGGGLVILAASRGLALESSSVGHGLFTKAVLDSIVEMKADVDGDNKVDVSELINYVEENVPLMASERGFEQRVVPIMENTTLLSRWILAEATGSAIPFETAQRMVADYKTAMTRWLQRRLLTAIPLGNCSLVLDRWLETYLSNVGLSDDDAFRLDQIRTIMSNETWDDETKAETMSRVCGDLS